MAYIPPLTGNYVKFIRGTPMAWQNFAVKDKDTLYFIAEKEASVGKLYLGDVLISDGTVDIVQGLPDLLDLNVSSPIYHNSLLVYNAGTQKWENQPLGRVLSALEGISIEVMQGAQADKDGNMGLVPAPTAGKQNLFLRGDATWADPMESVSGSLEALNNKFNSLYDDTYNSDSIRNIAINEVSRIVGAAPENFDTLKEIADWITHHSDISDVTKLDERLVKVENVLFDTTESIEEDGEVIEVAIPGLITTVSNLENLLTNENTGLITRVETIEQKIEESLTWDKLV